MSTLTVSKIAPDKFTSYLGVAVALVSVTMLFVSLLVSYAILRIQLGYWRSPGNGELPLVLAIANTLVLLISSVVYHRGNRELKNGNEKSYQHFTTGTLLLGVWFLMGQLFLWSNLTNQGFTPESGIIGSVFFMLTGMHGLHIIAGLIALIWVKKKVKYSSEKDQYAEMTGLFWHFLDLLWIGLFTAIFII